MTKTRIYSRNIIYSVLLLKAFISILLGGKCGDENKVRGQDQGWSGLSAGFNSQSRANRTMYRNADRNRFFGVLTGRPEL